MTGNHKDKSITRRRAIAVTGGTVAAGGLAIAGYQAAFADAGTTTTDAATTATTAASESTGTLVLAHPIRRCQIGDLRACPCRAVRYPSATSWS